MKKTYIIPETIVVRLMPTTAMLQAVSNPSVTVNTEGSVNATSVDTKGVSDVNVWDEEW